MHVRPGLGKCILLVLAILATGGCDAVLSTAQLTPIREDGLLGQWKDLGVPGSSAEADPMLIRFTDGAYRIGTADEFAKGQESEFTLGRVGNVLIAQSPSTDCDEFSSEKGKPCWLLNRVELARDRLNWYDFDAERLGRESYRGTLNVGHAVHRQRTANGEFDNTVLLGGDGPALERFLESYVHRRGAFRLTGRLERLH